MNTEIHEYRGIDNLVAAEVIKDDAEGYETGEVFYVAGTAELTKKTESSSEAHYYDNRAAVVVNVTGKDEVTVSASALALDVYAKLTGQEFDEATGTLIEGERTPAYFALGYITEREDGSKVLVWRNKGMFNIPDFVHKTKDEGTEANGQELVFTGINTTHKFTVNGKKKTSKAVVTNAATCGMTEEEFFSTVQTPETIVKAV